MKVKMTADQQIMLDLNEEVTECHDKIEELEQKVKALTEEAQKQEGMIVGLKWALAVRTV